MKNNLKTNVPYQWIDDGGIVQYVWITDLMLDDDENVEIEIEGEDEYKLIVKYNTLKEDKRRKYEL